MIAAGEVIERPASVVKELIENSIDAAATRITITVEDGGRKLIAVTDNGTGMDGQDLERAFLPHATSKIKTSNDLLGISTLGFRGEALASIAAVAQVKAVSRIKDCPAANCIEIDCGTKTPVTPTSADYGTTIQVRDIFYKLPARRKFLKTANTEMTHITEQFTRIALAHPSLNMTLIHNDRPLYQLSGNHSLRQRIAELFSKEISENLIDNESREKGLDIFALMGKPGISRTNSKFQYTFLNGRFIRDKFISHAIKEAYRPCLEPNRFPVIFLFIRMPYEDFDVNVHPTKIEVRFYNANLLHSQILACLREKLLQTNLDVAAKLPTAKTSFQGNPHSLPAGPQGQGIADAMADFFKKYKPGQTQQQITFPRRTASSLAGHGSPLTQQQAANDQFTPPQSIEIPKSLQIHDSFIISETPTGFVIVDQHALHERIIYENLRKRLSTGKLLAQKLLIPESFEVTDAQANTVKNQARLIEQLGIELVPFGPKTMAVQAFPVLLAKIPPIDFVQDLIDLLAEKNLSQDADSLLDQVLNMAACKAAIKAGQKLTSGEIEQLLTDKQAVDNASRCPHGRPTTIEFTTRDLEKQFKRT